ncbi:MAG TPA: DUF1801 domain-containing protein [Glaciihabitans sp.]|jgi:hypothetical protein|nr:DUF1801 domain-containing protein [Glaciihabitans sp.]
MPGSTIDKYISGINEPLKSVAITVRDHMDATLQEATGQMWHGHPVWLDNTVPVAGFKAYRDWVTVMFWRGQDIDDSTGLLQSTGSSAMAVVKFSNAADVHGPHLREWLSAVGALKV